MDDRGERGHAGHTPYESCRDRHRSYGGRTQDQPSTGCGEEDADADGGAGGVFPTAGLAQRRGADRSRHVCHTHNQLSTSPRCNS